MTTPETPPLGYATVCATCRLPTPKQAHCHCVPTTHGAPESPPPLGAGVLAYHQDQAQHFGSSADEYDETAKWDGDEWAAQQAGVYAEIAAMHAAYAAEIEALMAERARLTTERGSLAKEARHYRLRVQQLVEGEGARNAQSTLAVAEGLARIYALKFCYINVTLCRACLVRLRALLDATVPA